MHELDPIPPEPRSPDEVGEAPGTPNAPRKIPERGHESDSSGLAVDDAARAAKRRQQYREGASEVSETD